MCGISSTTWPPRSARVLSVGTISRITDAVADAVLRVAAPPAGGVLLSVVYHRRDSGRWSVLITGSPPARLTSRSGRGMDGCQHVA